MASLSRQRVESNVVLVEEPWMVVDGTPPQNTEPSTKQLVKVCNAGQVVWIKLDLQSQRSYEFLTNKLQLNNPTFVVDDDEHNTVQSTPDLQRVLKEFDPDCPLRLEVKLGSSMKQSLLAQSFVFLDMKELIQNVADQEEQTEEQATMAHERKAEITKEVDVDQVLEEVEDLEDVEAEEAEEAVAAVAAEAAEEAVAAVQEALPEATQTTTNNDRSLHTQFPYHCPNWQIRSWLHAIYSRHGKNAEQKVLAMKTMYRQDVAASQAVQVLVGPTPDALTTLQYEQIELDIPRTFSISTNEVRQERDDKLRRILRVISSRVTSGYVQGQNFIIGYLLTVTTTEADIFALFMGLMDNEEEDQAPQPNNDEKGSIVASTSADTTTSDTASTTTAPTTTTLTTLTTTVPHCPEYGLVGMYDTNMPRLNALVYIVDAALPTLAPDLHHHLLSVGITTSLLYVPGWSLTLFTNRLDGAHVCPLFDQIMHGGYYALVRLCLATLLAHKEQLMACEFDTCLLLLQQHMWTQKDVSRKIVEALLNIRFEKDNQLHLLEKEYVSGEASGVDNGGGVCRGGVKKKTASAATKKVMDKQSSSSSSLSSLPRIGLGAAVVATTLLAGLGAMLLMGGGESSGSARGSDDNSNRSTGSETKEEL